MSEVVAQLDNWGQPAWIAVMVAGFVIFWPVGLGILAYLIWSGRMGCGRKGMRNPTGSNAWPANGKRKMQRVRHDGQSLPADW